MKKFLRAAGKGGDPIGEEKRYYWMKLRQDLMASEAVDYLMSMNNGAWYMMLYEQICLRTINTQGRLCTRVGEILVPFTVEKLQRDCKWFSREMIQKALPLFVSLGLLRREEDGLLAVTGHGELVGFETKAAAKKRKQREKAGQNEGQNEGQIEGQCPQNVPPEYRDQNSESRDQSLENRAQSPDCSDDDYYNKGAPAREEVVLFCRQAGLNMDADAFYDYNRMKGWRIGGEPIADWQAAARRWAGQEKKNDPDPPVRDYANGLPEGWGE